MAVAEGVLPLKTLTELVVSVALLLPPQPATEAAVSALANSASAHLRAAIVPAT